jgi:ribosomal peptide maturation radical SAM protein 1
MPFRVALVSMPWPFADRPSIQLATLQAYLGKHLAGAVSVRAFHPYVHIAASLGFDVYQKIAEHSWVAEALYAPLLFPEQLGEAQKLIQRLSGQRKFPFPLDLAALSRKIQITHEQSQLFEQLAEADLVGISVCLAQLTSSLFLVRELKLRAPAVLVVLGGSAVCESMGRTLMDAFPEIDYIVNGEGEKPLLALVQALLNSPGRNLEGILGLFWRTPTKEIVGAGKNQIKRLDDLPVPTYDDYFAEVGKTPWPGTLLGQVPVESSRGCYWHRARLEHPRHACQFCNLNLQWGGYRFKSPERVARELENLIQKHKVLRFFFVDNTLSPANVYDLFRQIQALDCSLDLFVELRAPLTRPEFQEMWLAGVRQVQIGVEALASGLLAKMHKGTSAIENIEMMKRCEEFEIRNLSNLLMEFPGSDAEDVRETLAALDFVQCYQPLRPVVFWLGEASPVHMQPEGYGLSGIGNHHWYQALFPKEILAKLCLMQKSYRGHRALQRKLWRPVRERLKRWQQSYAADKKKYPDRPLLSYSDGRTFLVVRRRRAGKDQHEAYRLTGSSRDIYLYCDTRRRLHDIEKQFPRIKTQNLLDFLEDLVNKGLMYKGDDAYLSLAVNEDLRHLFLAQERFSHKKIASVHFECSN